MGLLRVTCNCRFSEYVRRHWAQAGISYRAGGGIGAGPVVIALVFRLWMTCHPGRAWMGSSGDGGGAGAGGATESGGASTA